MANAQYIQFGPFFSSGALVTAPKLYHYAVGTTTNKDIWSDRAESTTLAQPFIGDANGVFNFFGDGLYDLVIKDSADNTLYTLDDVLIKDLSATSLEEGAAIPSASTTVLGSSAWAHITGTTDIDAFDGTIPLFWAVFDGTLTLQHSSNLLLFNSVDFKVQSGSVVLFLNEGGGVWRQASGCPPTKQPDIASASSITAPSDGSFVDITGTTTITAVASINAGHTFRARCTGAGLNITYNATSMITPWARDYRTVQNEILEFTSLGSGNTIVYSINGPKERVGQVAVFDSTNAPNGFLSRDGAAVSRTTYSGLFAEIGTAHGVGDGSTTFNVPDGRGRVDLQVDGAANRITAASTNGGNADTLGGVGGTETHTLQTTEMPAHSHDIGIVGQEASDGAGGGTAVDTTPASTTPVTTTGGGGAHSNTQPWIATNKYIRF